MVRLAVKQLRELIAKARKWIVTNPLTFFLLLILLAILIWMIIETTRQNQLGFSDKTLWDWLDLIIVSAVITLGLFWLRQREDKRDEERQKREKELEEERQKRENEREEDRKKTGNSQAVR